MTSSNAALPSSGPKETHKSLKTFLAGGVAGCLAKSLVAPIDRVKILIQVNSGAYATFGIYESFVRIVQREGYRALYKGNGAQMLRIFPYAAMQYTSFETFKRLNRVWFKHKADRFVNNLACGSLAGVSAVVTTYPLDMIRSRLAFQFKGEHYAGIVDCMRKIYQESNSVRSFYRGFSVTLIGMIPYAGISFSTFDRLKHLVISRRIDRLTVDADKKKAKKKPTTAESDEGPRYLELTVVGRLLCGAATGIVAQTITYPIDVVRRHMQLDTMFKEDGHLRRKMGMFQTFQYIFSKHGLMRGFYRGITLNYVRAVPMVSTSFCCYELGKKYLGLQTGELIKLG